MPITIQLDVTKLSKEEKLNIMKEILKSEPSMKEAIIESDNSINTLPDDAVEAMIMDDFKKYDEIFKALA